MEQRKDVTVPMPAELEEAVTEELEYGDSKAGWIREAIMMRLEAENPDFERPDDDPAETDGGEHVLAD